MPGRIPEPTQEMVNTILLVRSRAEGPRLVAVNTQKLVCDQKQTSTEPDFHEHFLAESVVMFAEIHGFE